MMKPFYKIYWRLEKLITPSLKYSQSVYEEILFANIDSNFIWLDLGCGHQLLPSWRQKQEKSIIKKAKFIVGIDYDLHSLKKHKTITNLIRADIAELPFESSSFDLITSNMVFEHLDKPDVQLTEVARILKPGGKLIFHTPNVFNYATIMARMIPEKIKDKLVYILQGRSDDDLFPAFYKINSRSEINKLADLSGFTVKDTKMICSTATFIIFPPLVVLELIWIRLLMTKIMKPLRGNIIAILEKR